MKKIFFLWILFSQVEKEIKEVRENVWAELIFHQFSSHKHRTESSLDQTWKMDHQKKKEKLYLPLRATVQDSFYLLLTRIVPL